MNLKNNIENAEYFKRYVKGARLARGKGISNKNIIHLNVINEPQIKVLANIQGSNNAKYVIDISEENGNFTVIHDCPDFKKGFNLCKHVVKVLLLLEPQVCGSICKNISGIKFSSNFNLIKQSKTENYTSKAEELLKDSKYYEAITFLEQAYTESKDFSCIEKIKEISLQHQLYDQFLKLSIKFNQLADQNYAKLPEIVNNLLDTLDKYDFSRQTEIIGNLYTLLNSLSSEKFTETFQSLQINAISNKILKFFLLQNLAVQIEINKYFPKFLKDPKTRLSDQMEQQVLYSTEEAILNMDSIENVEAYLKIADECNLNNKTYIRKIVGEYRVKLNALFLEGLKKKHAFLRSLVIENNYSDKLTPIKFSTRYNYPTLVWASIRRNESPLYYYVIQKCGIEKHHLEYTDQAFFIENFPVFKEIFDGNNPIEHKVEDFWGTDDPKIKNIVNTNRIVEVNYQINLQDLEQYVLVEWDLAQRPILGSYICQFSDGFIISDKNHPLTNEIKPFDLILCYKKPVEIKAGNIKIIRPVHRVNFKTAVELVWKGLDFISSYIPFEIITKLKNYKIDELDAYDHIEEQFQTSFLPNKEKVKKAFFKFIQIKILKELNQIYLSVLEKPDYKKKVLKMIGLERYSMIFTNKNQLNKFKSDSLKRESLQILKADLKNEIGKTLTRLIKKESYSDIKLKELKRYPIFRKWALKIIMEQKKKLEKCKIYKETPNQYDVHEFVENYYGKIILEDLTNNGMEIDYESKPNKILIEESGFEQLLENFEFLKINPPRIISSPKKNAL
jgi:hypothetical protein